jgi:hypothetical protein
MTGQGIWDLCMPTPALFTQFPMTPENACAVLDISLNKILCTKNKIA